MASCSRGERRTQAVASTPSTKAARGFTYFSERVRTATNDAQSITFTPALLAAIAPELEKVRAAFC